MPTPRADSRTLSLAGVTSRTREQLDAQREQCRGRQIHPTGSWANADTSCSTASLTRTNRASPQGTSAALTASSWRPMQPTRGSRQPRVPGWEHLGPGSPRSRLAKSRGHRAVRASGTTNRDRGRVVVLTKRGISSPSVSTCHPTGRDPFGAPRLRMTLNPIPIAIVCHSARKVAAGSMRLARRAGRNAASAPTARSSAGAARNATASRPDTP